MPYEELLLNQFPFERQYEVMFQGWDCASLVQHSYQATAACLINSCGKALASSPNARAKFALCWPSGSLALRSQERTKACAIPIFAATWPGVRFFRCLWALIQSPMVFTLSINGLACACFLDLRAYFTEIRRCHGRRQQQHQCDGQQHIAV